MVSEIKKTDPHLVNFSEEEGMDELGLENDLDEEEKNPFYEEDENGEEFLQ